MEIRFDRATATSKYESIAKENISKKEAPTMSVERFDKIKISKEAKDISLASRAGESIVAAMNREISAERIKEIKEQILNGTYKVPARDIAEAILQGINN